MKPISPKSPPRVALVTGGNRGIGLQVCRELATQGIATILTSRDERKGAEAADRLVSEGLPIRFHVLDVSDAKSIERCFEWVRAEFDRLDILVNNAGIMIDSQSADWDLKETSAFKAKTETILETFQVNTIGPFLLCQRFIPLMMRHGFGRVVNVSSGMGQLSEMGPGWPAYRISKTAINAVTRIFAAETRGSNILVNSASPGWVKTEMGGEEAPGSVEEGADTLVWLATLPDGGPTGGFYEDREPMDW